MCAWGTLCVYRFVCVLGRTYVLGSVGFLCRFVCVL